MVFYECIAIILRGNSHTTGGQRPLNRPSGGFMTPAWHRPARTISLWPLDGVIRAAAGRCIGESWPIRMYVNVLSERSGSPQRTPKQNEKDL